MQEDNAEDYDIIVIGGGINGAGIARDTALRGFRVLLLEQQDFGSGTTSWSSRLVHGGLRYLEYAEFSLVFESLLERRRLLRIAPHLVDRLRIAIPVHAGGKRGMWMLRLGMLAYDLLSLGKKLPRHRMMNRDAFLERVPGVKQDGLQGGAEYYDAQVAFAERLVIENVVAAVAAGGVLRNYCRVTRIDTADQRVRGVRYLDEADGVERIAKAPVVINAAGPWVDRVLATAEAPVPRLMGGTKGSHIVTGVFDGAPPCALYVEALTDGRPFFILPWNGQFLIGTTDIRYTGDPGEARASSEEVDYLLRETNRVIPAARLGPGDIHFAYAGVRPLPWRAEGPESAITRRHAIEAHEGLASGLLSVVGGKLTTFRSLAEQVTDRAAKCLGRPAARCRTREQPLPGAVELDEAASRLAAEKDLPPDARRRLLAIYGSRALRILDLARAEPGLAGFLDSERTVLAAEVAFAVREELARHLVDIIHRRTMTGLAAGQGAGISRQAAAVAADCLGWDAPETARQLEELERYNARLRPDA